MTNLITNHLDIWTTAQIQKSNGGRGRGNNGNGQSLHGIKKLRELILELAVRGKLVPQDPDDEPASVLLERISKEKNRLIKEGKIKKQKPLPKIGEDEKPFDLPRGWEWTRLGVALKKITDGTHHSPPNTEVGEFLYISAKNIKPDGLLLTNATFVTKEIHEEIYSRCDPELGDILYIKDGATTGIAIINNLQAPFSMLSSVALLKTFKQIYNKYLLFTLTAPYFYNKMRSGMTGVAITRVTLKILNYASIPLPPLAEQHRIVARVDELMALCDQMEQQQIKSNETHQTLVETLLTELTKATDQKECDKTWQRIADHFDTLFITEQSIDQLKQTILQLAVMGKLVPQDPNDEPAGELLKKIAKEKNRLIKEGKIKKQKPLPGIKEDEKPFNLSSGWEWVKWDSIAMKIGDIDHKMPEQIAEGFPYVSPKDFLPNNKIDLKGAKKISKEDFLRLSAKIQPQKGDIIYPRYGTIGENRLVDTEKDFLASYSCCVIKTMHGFIVPEFQFIFSISSLARNQAKQAENKTTQANVGIKSIQNYIVPLPPYAEQKRIVAKVDELMVLCDDLKERLNNAQTTQVQLADAIVEQTVT